MKIKGEVINLVAPQDIKFKVLSIDIAAIKPNEVVAKTLFSAISPGTETAAYLGMEALRPGKIFPRLLGYCNAAEVVIVGSNVIDVKPGDLILTGESHRSIFVIEKENILAKIPKNVSPENATITYLYNLGLTCLQTIKLNSDTQIAVIGMGVLGLGAIELANNLKVETFAFSNSSYKLKLAKKLGANKVYLKAKNEKCNNIADMVIVTSNSWEDWHLALQLVKRNGVITVLGFPGRGLEPPNFNPLDPKYFYTKKVAIIPVGRSLIQIKNNTTKNNCRKILSLISKKELNPQNLISGIYSYKEIERLYEVLISRDQKSITYVLQWAK